jgi:hypothetical protein
MRVVLHQGARHAIEPLVVALHDDAEGVAVAPARQPNQRRIVEAIQFPGSLGISGLHRSCLSCTL